uniref:Transmembrane protein 135 N-terminal domain-containing protein n=1 Tax=Tetraselmis sp. GSL018 TaxID=582737 RepID=A0A061S335_9CHLO
MSRGDEEDQSPSSPTAGSKSCDEAKQSEFSRFWNRFGDSVIKSAAIGLSLRGGLHILSVTLSQLRAGKRDEKRSTSHLLALGADTIKFASFLSCFSGTFVTVDEALACFLGKERTKHWRAAVAGACAAPTIFLAGGESHFGLAAYILLRGLLLLVRCGNKSDAPPIINKMLFFTRWEHSDVILVCLASSQLLPAWIVFPETLPRSYVRFLNLHGGKDQRVYDGLREWILRPAASRAALPMGESAGRPPNPCQLVHPGLSCASHAVQSMPASFRRALSV